MESKSPPNLPLYHWLAALTAKSMNQLDEFTVRFPSAFLGTLGVLLTYLAGAILWGRSAGLVAALILSTSFEWRQAAKVARVDMTLTFVLLCAFLFFLYSYRTGGGRKKAIILGLILGLATLARGPLGFVVPGFTYLLFLWVRRDLSFVRRLHPFYLLALVRSWQVHGMRWLCGRGQKLFRGRHQGKFLHDDRPRSWTSPSVFLVYPFLFPKHGALEPLCYPTRCFALPLPPPIGSRAITLFCRLVWRGLHLFRRLRKNGRCTFFRSILRLRFSWVPGGRN